MTTLKLCPECKKNQCLLASKRCKQCGRVVKTNALVAFNKTHRPRLGAKDSNETRKKKSLASIRMWAKPGNKERIIAKRIGRRNTPDTLDKMSESARRSWENPEIREKRANSMRGTKHRLINRAKPNKTETRVMNLLDSLYPGEYEFVGNGKLWLGGRCPDFMNINGQKKLIELFGDYWHKGENPQERIEFFRQFGFDTLVIWENEFNNETERAVGMIREFHSAGHLV